MDTEEMRLAVAGIDYKVENAGPGERTELFLQGCWNDCPGCFNPSAKDVNGGRRMNIDLLIDEITESTPNKLVTICGGEPFIQAFELFYLVFMLKQEDFHILVYTGLHFEDLFNFAYREEDVIQEKDAMILGPDYAESDLLKIAMFQIGIKGVLAHIDLLVDGPFEQDKILTIGPGQFVGSSNQRIIDMPATLKAGNLVTLRRWDE